MAWEDRDGRRYYYRKARHGRRVVSKYVGRGRVPELLAELDQADRERREAERRQTEQERSESAAQLDRLDQAVALVELLTRGVLLANGYHNHRGKWRRMRDGRHANKS